MALYSGPPGNVSASGPAPVGGEKQATENSATSAITNIINVGVTNAVGLAKTALIDLQTVGEASKTRAVLPLALAESKPMRRVKGRPNNWYIRKPPIVRLKGRRAVTVGKP